MPRNYRQEYANESRARRKQRAERNAARRQLMREGLVHKGDGKDVNHIKPLSKKGSNSRSNLNVVPKRTNSSYKRTSSGAMKASRSYPNAPGRRKK
jgi:HNH endonuclease.